MNVIIDYKVGNLASVQRGFERANIDTIISDQKDVIQKADVLILPGVGAFKDAMDDLRLLHLEQLILDHVNQGKLLVGICLGMQLLYEESTEFGLSKGLGLFKGQVTKINTSMVLPHMGWNQLLFKKNDQFLNQIEEGDYVYFIHTYQAPMTEDVIAYTTYDQKIPAIVRKDNVIGMQFHPEKSGEVGLKLLKNIKEMIQ